jgi:hypothetical protein
MMRATHGAHMRWGFAGWKEFIEVNAFIQTETTIAFLAKQTNRNILNFIIYCFYDNIHFIPCQHR